mmetsp:Transcript_3401/g.4522  ORF Transcript_3401/g.4522 Transcript_3401/m.4522 type:complete len:352 (-) Transcript_3401:411-1466(-)
MNNEICPDQNKPFFIEFDGDTINAPLNVYWALFDTYYNYPRLYGSPTINNFNETVCLPQSRCYYARLVVETNETEPQYSIKYTYDGSAVDIKNFYMNQSELFGMGCSRSLSRFHITYVWILFFVVYIAMSVWKNRRRRRRHRQLVQGVVMQTTTSPGMSEEMKRIRRGFVLSNLIQKKVIAMDQQEDTKKEPPKTILQQIEDSFSIKSLMKDDVGVTVQQQNTSESSLDVEKDATSPITSLQTTMNEFNKEHNKDDIVISANNHNSKKKTLVQHIQHHLDIYQEDSTSSLHSPRSCPICMELYHEGESVAWSRNEKCHHVFHLDCLMDWLMENDDCPMCREKYLFIDTDSA